MQEHNGWNSLFWCNHDQPRIVSRMGRKRLLETIRKDACGSSHLMRGTPYIYQGEEIGMLNAHFKDIADYRDVESLNYYEILLKEGKTKEEAIKTLQERSRDNSRTPMQWSDEENAGFSDVTPWISVPDHYEEINVENELKDQDSIYYFYKKLIELRKEKEVIQEGTIEFFEKGG